MYNFHSLPFRKYHRGNRTELQPCLKNHKNNDIKDNNLSSLTPYEPT